MAKPTTTTTTARKAPAKAPAKAKAPTTAKAPAKAKPSAAAAKVAKLRGAPGKATEKTPSWATIGKSLTPPVSPATARRLYDSVHGTGAHHGLIPGRGGRRPVAAAK